MDSHERNLSNQRLFNVGVTRVRDDLTMVVDDKEKLERQLDNNSGNKTSALETLGRLDIDGGSGPGDRAKFHPSPVDGGPATKSADLVSDLPPLSAADGKASTKGEPDYLSAPALSPTKPICYPRCPSAAWGSTCDLRGAGRVHQRDDAMPEDAGKFGSSAGHSANDQIQKTPVAN